MTNYEIISTDTFEKELNNTFNYINFFLNEHITAEKFYDRILNSILSLEYFPKRFLRLRDFKKRNLHRLVVDNYVILYEINDIFKQVYVLHIFNSNQNYLNLL